MEITPSDINPPPGTLATVDPKLVQLIKSFADRPLILEKLILSQSQGLLLRLVAKAGNLNLQLPLGLNPLFENTNPAKPQLSIMLTANQRVIIRLAETPLKAQTSSKAAIPNNPLQQQVIQFKTAQLLPNKTIKLTEARPVTSRQIENLVNSQAKLTAEKATNEVLPVAISVAVAASQILSRHFAKQNPVATHLTRTKQIIEQFKTIDNPSPAIRKLIHQTVALLNSLKISSLPTGESIKQRIRSSGNLLENTASRMVLRTTGTKPAAELISKSSALNNSKAIINPTSTSNLSSTQPNRNVDNSYIPPSLRHFVKSRVNNDEIPTRHADTRNRTGTSATTNTKERAEGTSKQPVDLKLQLMQIRATLESLIKNEPGKEKTSKASRAPQFGSVPDNPRNPTPKQANASISSQARAPQANSQTVSTQADMGQPYRSPEAKPMLLLRQQNAIFKPANELLTEVRSMISQIESNQLHSLKNEQSNLQQFLVDLPFGNEPDIDSFELLFERGNGNSNAQKVKNWKVVVRFDLEPLGAMFAQIELVNERVSTHIFAKSQQTAVLINKHMHVLKKSLFSAGVDIDQLKSSQGNIPEKLVKSNPNQVDLRV